MVLLKSGAHTADAGRYCLTWAWNEKGARFGGRAFALPSRCLEKWSERGDLNSRPPGPPERGELFFPYLHAPCPPRMCLPKRQRWKPWVCFGCSFGCTAALDFLGPETSPDDLGKGRQSITVLAPSYRSACAARLRGKGWCRKARMGN